MKELSQKLPYPIEIQKPHYSDLENYLLKTIGGDIYSYENLPNEIKADDIELYANWLSNLSVLHHNEFNERGAFVFYDERKQSIIYPSNPQSGNGYINPVYPQNHNCIPLMLTHSHSDNEIFSSDGDLTFMYSRHDQLGKYPYIKSFQVSSLERNYLLLRTKETPESTTSDFDYYTLTTEMRSDNEYREIKNHFKLNNNYGLNLTDSELKRFRLRLLMVLENPTSMDTFQNLIFNPHINAYIFSKTKKIGLYFSEKDGIYKRYDVRELKSYLTKNIYQEVLGLDTKLQ